MTSRRAGLFSFLTRNGSTSTDDTANPAASTMASHLRIGATSVPLKARPVAETTTETTLDNFAAKAYSQAIAHQLEEERALKTSFEQRAIAVITSSGVMVTLLFAFSTLTSTVRSTSFTTLPVETRALLGLGLSMFAAAILLAVRVNRPSDSYWEITNAGLERMLNIAAWANRNPVISAFRVAEVQVKTIQKFRAANLQKSTLLRRAMMCEISGIIALGAAIITILIHG